MSDTKPLTDEDKLKKWIANNGFDTADRIGDTTGVISVAKRALQATRYIPNTDAINIPFTLATAWIGSLCYFGAAASIYLDQVKYARNDYQYKAHIFTLTGAQCAILSTLSPANLALPSFVISGAVDLITAFYNTLQSMSLRLNFESWLEDKLQELQTLEKLGKEYDEQHQSLLQAIKSRLAVNYPQSNINNINTILLKYSQDNLLDNLAEPMFQQMIDDERIKKEMNNEIANCIATFIARLASFLGFIFLQTAIVSLQPYVIPLLIVGAAWYGARTTFAACKFFSSCCFPKEDESLGLDFLSPPKPLPIRNT